MIISGDWVEVPRNGSIRKAEVIDTYTIAYTGHADTRNAAILQDVESGEVFESSLESCVEVER